LQDELLSTELLFRGLLTGLSPEEAVALMSALVFQVRQQPGHVHVLATSGDLIHAATAEGRHL
jgi:antiviral helicase SKI2